MTRTKVAILVVAGGTGERMESEVPKQYRELGGIPVLRRTLEALLGSTAPGRIWVAIHPKHRALFKKTCGDLPVQTVIGGATRQASVYAGLKAMAKDAPEYVLIHDAVRPFVSPALMKRIVTALKKDVAVIPGVKITDTLKATQKKKVTSTVARESLIAVQTPQGFRFDAIYRAHKKFAGKAMTDDAALMEVAGHAVTWIKGERRNIKLTMPEDWAMAEKIIKEGSYHVGMGYDVHRLLPHAKSAKKRVVRLGGMDIPHTHYLDGHSDADVVLHALVDAMLGAIGAGDIGQHFPPSNPKWKNADSALFIKEACRLLKARGGTLVNADITIICEKPKIAPYRDAMQHRLAGLLGVKKERINVKATTTEGLGFTGRGEGIAAQAVVMVRLPAG